MVSLSLTSVVKYWAAYTTHSPGKITFNNLQLFISLYMFADSHPFLYSPRVRSRVTVTKCNFPEPSVEFYQNATGFKSSISGLSVAVTGVWKTHCGLM